MVIKQFCRNTFALCSFQSKYLFSIFKTTKKALGEINYVLNFEFKYNGFICWHLHPPTSAINTSNIMIQIFNNCNIMSLHS
jgi:hypothetical protein